MNGVRITKWQMISIGTCYIIGVMLNVSKISATAGRDAWLIPLAAFAAFVPAMIIYCLLVKLHPQKSLYEINETSMGKVIGKVFTLLYMLFFLHICTLNAMKIEVFVSGYLLPGTPVLICGVLMMAFCSFVIYRGLNVIIIAPFAFGIISGTYLVLNFIQGIPQMRPEFLQPVLAQKPQVYMHATHIELATIYGELIGMLTLAGMLDKKAKFSSCLIITMIISSLYLVLVHLRERMLLGDLTPYMSFPSFEAVRVLGRTSDTISRMESIYSLVMVSFSIFRVLLMFWAVLAALKQLLNLQSYNALILPVGAFITVYSMRIYASPNDSYLYGINTTPFIWGLFAFVLPLITLIFAVVRKFTKKVYETNTAEMIEPNGAEGF